MALFGWQSAVFFSYTNSAPASSHQPASSIFLSQEISTSHQPPASRTRLYCWWLQVMKLTRLKASEAFVYFFFQAKGSACFSSTLSFQF
jgi:hypothetical protein